MTNGKKAVPPGNLTLRPRYRHRRLENNRTAKVPIKALSPAMLWASTVISANALVEGKLITAGLWTAAALPRRGFNSL
jgi:hypothetical protein